MSMTESVHPNAGDEIEITAPFPVVNIAALAARRQQRITGIVLEQILALQIDDGLRGIRSCRRQDAGHSLIIPDRTKSLAASGGGEFD
jgi:hypothetical protein